VRAALGAAAVACLLVSGVSAGSPGADPPAPDRIPRWESTLSLGRVSTGRIGAVKSFWWFAVPRVIALGLTFDWISDNIPFSLAVAVSAPIPVAAPFACAGIGGGLNGCGLNYYGGGLKVRLSQRFGIIAEYRNYRFTTVVSAYPPRREKGSADFIGAGIAWFY